jgi:hypothetical protein
MRVQVGVSWRGCVYACTLWSNIKEGRCCVRQTLEVGSGKIGRAFRREQINTRDNEGLDMRSDVGVCLLDSSACDNEKHPLLNSCTSDSIITSYTPSTSYLLHLLTATTYYTLSFT